MNNKSFKYNMSFYYQSTIIYFVVFIVYLFVRGEFFENNFILVIDDPILHFLGLISFVSVLSLLYNLYKNRRLQVSEEGLTFISRFKRKEIKVFDIKSIKFFRERNVKETKGFRLVAFSLKNRKRPLLIRPYDYENEAELITAIEELKLSLNPGANV